MPVVAVAATTGTVLRLSYGVGSVAVFSVVVDDTVEARVGWMNQALCPLPQTLQAPEMWDSPTTKAFAEERFPLVAQAEMDTQLLLTAVALSLSLLSVRCHKVQVLLLLLRGGSALVVAQLQLADWIRQSGIL